MSKFDKTQKAAAAAAATAGSVIIEQPRIQRVALEVKGTAPLVQNAFGQKAIEQMLRKHMGITVQRETKKPRELIENAKIKNVDGVICMPAVCFKNAMIGAAAEIRGLKKTNLRRQLYVVGNGIPIKFRSEVPRMDMVRNSGPGRVPDVRFRPMFEDWSACMLLEFGDELRVQTVVDLLNRAGRGGIGEWRPERNGSFGTFVVSRHISGSKEIAEVEEACSVALVTPVIPDWALDADIDPKLLQKIMAEGAEDDEEPASESKPTKSKRTSGGRR